ncbi:hypothetical protein AB0C69_19215, partial [Actinomadura sp. NPDC048032]|uniref:hypothetical protein n=1 Tax=Actinomadura sp. NPDC048032 TaxID=3155747 RepID=UPI0033F266C3
MGAAAGPGTAAAALAGRVGAVLAAATALAALPAVAALASSVAPVLVPGVIFWVDATGLIGPIRSGTSA